MRAKVFDRFIGIKVAREDAEKLEQLKSLTGESASGVIRQLVRNAQVTIAPTKVQSVGVRQDFADALSV